MTWQSGGDICKSDVSSALRALADRVDRANLVTDAHISISSDINHFELADGMGSQASPTGISRFSLEVELDERSCRLGSAGGAVVDRKWISGVEFGTGQTHHGTRVFLSDGSELAGVVEVEQRAGLDATQEITVRVIKYRDPKQ